jgi:hypothetical protein
VYACWPAGDYFVAVATCCGLPGPQAAVAAGLTALLGGEDGHVPPVHSMPYSGSLWFFSTASPACG